MWGKDAMPGDKHELGLELHLAFSAGRWTGWEDREGASRPVLRGKQGDLGFQFINVVVLRLDLRELQLLISILGESIHCNV